MLGSAHLTVDAMIVPVGSKWLVQWPMEGDENMRIVQVTAVGDWFGLLTQAVAARDCFEAVGAHASYVCVSLGVPHEHAISHLAFRGLTKTIMSRITF